jgi:F-type H+-transporting ATPase subunit gamma
MSKRHDLETKIRSLNDIKDIMNAMKNLSLMESHRLARFLDTQRRVVSNIESAATDFLAFYPDLLPSEEFSQDVYLLLGSERGFCGDFNESLLKALDREGMFPAAPLIAVGGKLASKLAAESRVASFVDGASVVEEIGLVLSNVVEAINRLSARGAVRTPLRLTVFHHDPDHEAVDISVLQPFQRPKSGTVQFAFDPMLNLEPRSLLAGLAEQYLTALLHELFYRSLMAENQRRMQHMDSAIQRLEHKSVELWQRRNMLRQEEITEEIEIIMLSLGSVG